MLPTVCTSLRTVLYPFASNKIMAKLKYPFWAKDNISVNWHWSHIEQEPHQHMRHPTLKLHVSTLYQLRNYNKTKYTASTCSNIFRWFIFFNRAKTYYLIRLDEENSINKYNVQNTITMFCMLHVIIN